MRRLLPFPAWAAPLPSSLLPRPVRGGILLLAALVLAGCDGSNLFSGSPVVVPPAPPVDARAEVLRYLEEGTLLVADATPLRFRWMTPGGEIPLRLPPDLPSMEREAILRAASLVRTAGGPTFRTTGPGTPEGAVRVESLALEAYREVDPTRPWSFSRTFVTATAEEGILEVRIVLAEGQPEAVVERAALHALGHALGIMGHPAFPGRDFVMASSAEGAAPPTRFHPREEEAIRFLYSPGVAAGMTREEIRAAWAAWGG